MLLILQLNGIEQPTALRVLLNQNFERWQHNVCFEPRCHNIDIEKVPDIVLVSAHSYCFMVPVCEKNKRLSGAFTRAVNSLKTRETPKQEQICIKKHKNVKLQATHTLAKGSQKRIQMMTQSPND